MLGIIPDTNYEIKTVPFQHGDTLLLYTDGLIDAMDFDDKTWGKELLMDVLKNHPFYTAQQLVHTILRYRRRHVGLAQQTDDTSIVVIRRDDNANTCDEDCNCIKK